MQTYVVRLITFFCVAVIAMQIRSARATPLSLDQKTLFASLAAVDDAFELLAVQYGVDRASPVLSTNDSFQATGFDWKSTGTYLGKGLTLAAAGVYDPTLDQVTWSGGGSYAGSTWSLAGNVTWLSDISFKTSLNESIIGISTFVSPAADVGSITVSPDGQSFVHTWPSSTLWTFLGLATPVEDKETLTIPAAPIPKAGQTVTESVTVLTPGSKVDFGGKGTIAVSSTGLSVKKETTITTAVPEPSSLRTVLGGTILLIAMVIARGKARKCRKLRTR
jgi:hypothetical protein